MMAGLVNLIKNIINIHRNYKELYDLINNNKQELEGLISETETRVTNDSIDRENSLLEKHFMSLLSEPDKMKKLNYVLSATPVIWGDEDRLEISDKAAVNHCFFNTNSGKIKIGDFTFAGSGVSVLAGSHDPETAGFIRRDTAYKEGFDIEIGKGVWLGSNSTILGPCVIDDDAVVAAGAVVVPGTHIGKGELFAGIPAKKIRDLTIVKNLEESPEKMADTISREDGMLCYSGWEERSLVIRGSERYIGHRSSEDTAIIFSNNNRIKMILFTDDKDDKEECEISITIGDDKKLTERIGYEPSKIELFSESSEKPIKIVIKSEKPFFVCNEV